jgi:mannose-1-phosphate guanylyltransferase
MKALLLAAGLGTRLRPITNTIPKCLVQIHGKPLLGYWLDMLFTAGVERILVNTHYLPEAVNSFIAGSRWKDAVDLVYEEELLGTGGTILKNRAYLQDHPFLVAHADNLTRFDVDAFASKHMHRSPKVEITMMTFATDAPSNCGIVELDDLGKVTAFHEKVSNPPGNHANAAVYIFQPTVIDYIESLKKTFVDVSTEVIPKYMGRIQTFHNSDYHRDIGTPESLAAAEIEF